MFHLAALWEVDAGAGRPLACARSKRMMVRLSFLNAQLKIQKS